jgi:hypothetical protein
MPYAENPGALPIDQHQLLALIAPRPVFLGNGRRDVWSDPTSTYEAAVLADKIYELYGVDGLNQRGLCDFNPDGEIAYHMRRGVHGITPGDIDAYIAFLDAHF